MTAAPRRFFALLATLVMMVSSLVAMSVPASAQAAEDYSILVFSKTAGFRHSNIDEGIAAIQQLGADNNVAVDATEDATAFTEDNLDNYAAVVFLSTTGDVLNASQQAAFENYVQTGGGFAGIHAASDTEYDWAWYGDLVGAYFQGHPPGTPQATIITEDHAHPSTSHLPTRWTRNDEWYAFQTNPRQDVHVLQSLDESTYTPGGNSMGLDHPISWCHNYDGGRSWYTGLGHTEASFADADFLTEIWGGIETAAGEASADCGASLTENFQKVTLDNDTTAPMAVEVAPDGRVFYIQRTGELKLIQPNGAISTAADLPVTTVQEFGLIGLALDPDFADNNWIYLAWSPSADTGDWISRFTMDGNTLDLDSEVRMLNIPTQRAECCHAGGNLEFDSEGNLYMATGDNTNPFASSGYSPIDERAGREAWDAQRSSANTNSLSGKLLRITPQDDGSYTVPDGNLIDTEWAADKDQSLIRPEIYAMGFRNPFRFGIDPLTDTVVLADYGPDAGSANANRGPDGRVEWNIIKEPGNYGWPYCVSNNVPYNDYNFATSTSGALFNCDNPVNESPNNTGLTELPPVVPADEWFGKSSTGTPEVGQIGAPMTSAPYRYDADLSSEVKWPAYWDGKNIFADWNRTNNAWWSFQVDDDIDKVEKINSVFRGVSFVRTQDFFWGPDGALYVVEWGNGYGDNNPDSGVYKIEYVGGNRSPVARIDADPRAGALPLEVDFSAARSNDPDGGDVTVEWDFDGDGTVDSTNVEDTYTYVTGGEFNALLTVTDDEGDTASASVTITAGNSAPVIDVNAPLNGGFFSFGDTVAYDLDVTDAEDGTVDCDDVITQPALGHDQHAHPYDQYTGCSGQFPIPGDTGHVGADIFGVITFTYTDQGGEGGAGSLTTQEVVKLNLRHTEAEYFAETGRQADGAGTDDPGVEVEDSDDSSAGSHVGFVQDGDWWSMDPANLSGIDTVDVAVGSAGDGGILELRADAPDGPVIASATVEPTGGWQTYETVTLDIPAGTTTDSIYFVAQSSDNSSGYLFNADYMDFDGQGVSSNRAPTIDATATPTSGEAPLDVDFSATATDPEGDSPLTYDWTFGDGGVADGADVSHTYDSPGDYTAIVTVADPDGASSTAEIDIEVDFPPGPDCDGGGGFVDDFDGDSLDARWSVLRPDGNLRVEDSTLVLPLTATDIYSTNNTDTPNIVHTPLPDGDFEITTEVTAQLYDAYQQAGLILYEDDDNYVKFVMEGRTDAQANPASRVMQLVSEVDGSPTENNSAALGAAFPDTVYIRLTGTDDVIQPAYSTDGENWTDFGTTANRTNFENLQMGVFALSGNNQPADEEAAFESFAYVGDGASASNVVEDDFEGTSLDSAWTVIRPDGNLRVEDSNLVLPVSATDIYGTNNTDTPNIVVRPLPDGAGSVTTVVDVAAYEAYEQAGLLLYQDDDNYVKLVVEGRDTSAANPETRVVQFLWEVDGTPTEVNSAALGAAFPDEIYLQLMVDAEGSVTPFFSSDGSDWQPIDAVTGIAGWDDVQMGLMALSGTDNSADEEASFDWIRYEGADGNGGGGNAGPVDPNDEFDGSELDLCRWTDSVRVDESAYEVTDGELIIQTGDGDIYQTPNGEPTNFILQPQPAEDEWTVEAKLNTSALYEQYQQGGLILYLDDDNYVKFDHVVTNAAGSAPSGLVELLSEIDGSVTAVNGPALAPQDELWLRLSRSGDTISGSYSVDGETWTDMPDSATNAAVAEGGSVGPFTVGTNQTNGSVPIAFDYFHVVEEEVDGTPPTVTATLLGTFEGSFTPTTGTAIEGTGEMIVEEDSTTINVDVGGLEPNSQYSGHLHDLACGEDGPHYRDDPDGATEPPNELWLSATQDPTAGFTTDADGNATATGVADWAARATAQSVMVHVGSTGLPIGCVDLDTSSGTVTVDLSAMDDTEVDYVEYRIDGGEWSEYTTEVEVSAVGNHVVEYRATDVDGNTSDIESASFTIADDDTPRILVFSKTAGFRHGSIPAGKQAITELANANGAVVDITENANFFSESYLAQFDAVVFLSTTGDVLNGVQQDAFEAYIQDGGGFAGVHAASDTEYDWQWYGDLVGAYFEGHPPGTPEATLNIEDMDHPSTSMLPEDWTRVDEWYSFMENPREDVHVLMTIDESTYAVGGLAMGDHPMSWCHDYDGGRSWYTALGHTDASFTTDTLFREHLWGGIATAAGIEDADCTVDEVEELTLDVTLDPADPDGRDGWYVSPVTVTATTNDDATIEFSVDGGEWVADDDGVLVVDADGSHTLDVRAVRGDETSQVESFTMDIDTTNPELMVDGITDGQEFAQGGGDEVTWSATDATSGVRIVRVRLDGVIIDRDLPAGGPFVPGSLEPGSYELFVRAHDVAGNYTTQRLDFTVTPPPDTTKPTITVTGVRNGGTYGDSRVLDIVATATDSESDLDFLRVWLDDDRIHNGDSPFELELGLWDLDLGEHTMKVVARDSAGNRRATTITFTVGTSITDVFINLDRFTEAGLITTREANEVAKHVQRAERHLDRGRTAQARTELQKARDKARDIDDYDVQRLLARDLTELIRDLNGDGSAANTDKDAAANAKAIEKSNGKAPKFVETPDFLEEDE